MVARIPIKNENGMFAVIDDDMEKGALCFKWTLNQNGEPRAQYPRPDYPKLYTSITLKSYVMMQRVVSPFVIKNLNGDLLDCRRENLAKMTLKEAKALDRKNLGPASPKKKVQRKWTKNLVKMPVPTPKPKKKMFELFPKSSSPNGDK